MTYTPSDGVSRGIKNEEKDHFPILSLSGNRDKSKILINNL